MSEQQPMEASCVEIAEGRRQETELLNAFKNDTDSVLFMTLKEEYRDVCSHGDVIVNQLLTKYRMGDRANDDEMYYISFIYDSFTNLRQL